MASRCDAKTKTGARCKRNRVSGEAFCHTHKNMEETKNIYCKKCVELGCGGASVGGAPPPPPPPPMMVQPRMINADLLGQLRAGQKLNPVHVEPKKGRELSMDELKKHIKQENHYFLMNRGSLTFVFFLK